MGERAEVVWNIQALRSLAALMVVVYHAGAMVRASLGHVPEFQFLEMGVDIFFVISGFIMVQSNIGRDRSPVEFWWLRLIRIAPTAWLGTTAMIAVFLMGFRPAGLNGFDLGDVIGSYAFLPVQRADGVDAPIVVPAWTLTYEMFFYLIFGCGLLLKSMRATLVFVAIVLGALVAAGALLDIRSFALDFYTRPILLEFLAGCGLGLWFTRAPVRALWKPWVAAALVAVGLGIPALIESSSWMWRDMTGVSRAGILGPSAFLVVFGALMLERSGVRAKSPAVAMLGDTSYALYIFHMLVAHAATTAVAPYLQPWRDEPWAVSALLVTLVVVSLAASIPVFYLFERPVTGWLRRLGRGPARASRNPVAIPPRPAAVSDTRG